MTMREFLKVAGIAEHPDESLGKILNRDVQKTAVDKFQPVADFYKMTLIELIKKIINATDTSEAPELE